MKKIISTKLRCDARFTTKETRIIFNILQQWSMVSGMKTVQIARCLAIVRSNTLQPKRTTNWKPSNNPINKKGVLHA